MNATETFINYLINWVQLILIIFVFGFSIILEREAFKRKLNKALSFLDDLESAN